MSKYKEHSTPDSGGIGFTGLLTIAFIVLKLLGKIDWSWWLVLSPVWVAIGLSVFVIIVLTVLENL